MVSNLLTTFILEELPCSMIALCPFVLKNTRRRFSSLRLCLCLLASFLLAPLLNMLGVLFVDAVSPPMPTPTACGLWACIDVLLCFIFLSLFMAWCCETAWPQILWPVLCAYLAQDIAYSLFVFCFPAGAHRGRASFSPTFLWVEVVILLIFNISFLLFVLRLQERKGAPHHIAPLVAPSLLFAVALGHTLEVVLCVDPRLQAPAITRLFMLQHIMLFMGIWTVFHLYREKLNYRSLATTELQLRQNLQKQMQTFQSNREDMNHKFHDFKHILSGLRAESDRQKKILLVNKLEEGVTIMDSHIRTNHSALNIILTDTMLNCDKLGIQWTCMADGSALSFMDQVDLCRLIGNALDNAVESVSKIEIPDKRFLSVNIWKVGGLSFIKIENYCLEVPEFKDGLPLSTKLDKTEHGYGMQSIRMITETYNGQFKINVQNNIFSLNIMFPCPSE